jgi:hypothetical protein
MPPIPPTPARIIAHLGQAVDRAVCAGAVANAARAVRADEVRAGQRREAKAAIARMQPMPIARTGAPYRSSARLAG